jgi:uncharacterized protein YhbP (UPF0306 family)
MTMQQDPNISLPEPDREAADQRRRWAMALIRRQRTMVLATSQGGRPWSAPVFYIYFARGFYFFSSPRSLHVEQMLHSDLTAASIYADGGRLDELEGIQMSGRIQHITQSLLKLSVTSRYLIKFPLAKPLFSGMLTAAGDLRKRVELYQFIPDALYYMNHHMGFGGRTAIEP